MNFLVIRFSSLGDVVIASSIVEALSLSYPDSSVHVLTKDAYTPLFDSDPRIARVTGMKKTDTISGLREKINDTAYDAVIDLHASMRSILVSAKLTSSATYRVKKHSLGRRVMVASRGLFRTSNDVLTAMLDTVRPLGIVGRIMPRLIPDENAVASIGEKLGNSGERFVGIAPGSLHETKRWNEGSFACLADKLSESGYTPVFIGDSGDRIVIERIRDEMTGKSLSFAGTISLGETVALIASLKAVVTNDSGPMHAAGALGTPFTAIFGPTHADLGFVPGYKSGTVIHSGAKCSPCSIHGEKKCRMKTRFCMDDIHWEYVYNSLEQYLT